MMFGMVLGQHGRMTTVRKMIVALACLVGLAVVVDFSAAAYTEYRVSRALRDGADLSADPEVTVQGFPFLTQAYDGKYRVVDIRARGLRADIVGEIMIEVTLRGVRLPLSSVFDGNVSKVPVDRIDGRMTIEATELGQLFGIPDLTVSAAPADKSDGTGGSGGSGMTTAGAIVLSGKVPLGLVKKEVSVQAELRLDGQRVQVVASNLYVRPGEKPDLSIAEVDRPAILAQFTKTIDTNQLPFGMLPTKASAQGSRIVIEATGDNAVIDLDQLQRQLSAAR